VCEGSFLIRFVGKKIGATNSRGAGRCH